MPKNETMHKNATLLLGMGAQRCGTTWLGTHLRSHPDIYMSAIKEMHFFVDPKYPNTWNQQFMENRLAKAKTGSEKLARAFSQRIKIGTSATHGIVDYINFFQQGWDEQSYYCEITPSYMFLPAEELRKIKTAFPHLKIIFLMRDPIARLWSMLRFNYRGKDEGQMIDFAASCLNHREYSARCDYRTALENLDAVFYSEQVFIGFYEDMFDGDLLNRLYAFLGVDPIVANTERRPNSSKTAHLPDELANYFAAELMPQYKYARSRFGDKVPEGWLF